MSARTALLAIAQRALAQRDENLLRIPAEPDLSDKLNHHITEFRIRGQLQNTRLSEQIR